MEDRKETRRDVVKKMAWAVPVVLSLTAKPARATSGSGDGGGGGECTPDNPLAC